MKNLIAFILLSCVFSNSVHAVETDSNSGNKLYEQYLSYKSNDGSFDGPFYMGYVSGLAAAITGERLICPPPEVTNKQLYLVVGNFLEANPARLHTSKAALALEALLKAFPCKK